MTQFTVQMQPPRKPPDLYIDATPWSIAIYDTLSQIAINLPSHQNQVHNELKALLLAVLTYGNTREYLTDCIASLCLQKRSTYAFAVKAMVASTNPRIRFVPSAKNLADKPSRDRYGIYHNYPRRL